MKLVGPILLLLPSLAFAGPTLSVDGSATTQPAHWTNEELHSKPGIPTTQVSYQRHGTPHHATCVAMLDLLRAAGVGVEVKMDPKADPHTKHAELRLVITAHASDGYAVVFSLAELLPEIGNHPVWLALDEDDQPLPDHDTPVKLIVPDDTKPARWVHGVEDLAVIEIKP